MIDGILGILAFAPPPEGGGGSGSFLMSLAPMVLIFAIFYFLLIAPARKKQRLHAEMLGALKAGDKVITNGGMLGTVVGVTDDVVQVRVADQVKIDFARNAIAGLQGSGDDS